MAAFGGPIAWGAPPPERFPQEIVVTARASDAVLAARVETSLAKDPYILSDHLTISVTNGVVRVRGLVNDVSDLLAILRLARRVAGGARVVNEIDFEPVDDDGN